MVRLAAPESGPSLAALTVRTGWGGPAALRGPQVLQCDPAEVLLHKGFPGRAAEMLQPRSRLQSWSFQAAWSPGAPGDLKSPPRPQVRHQDLGDPFCPSSQPSLQGGSRASALPVQEMWRRTGHRAFTTNNF